MEGSWVGNHVLIDDLSAGDLVRLTFPVKRQTLSYTANAHSPQEQEYRLELRGSTVVDISPRDDAPTSYPLYLRDALKADHAGSRTVQRFVPEHIVRGW